MSRLFFVLALLLAPVSAAAAASAADQTPVTAGAEPAAPAVQPAAPRRMPPAGSGPVVWPTEIRFHPVNESIIEPQTYLYYIQTPLSRPSEGAWVPFNDATEKSLLEDFKRLWATNFLDNLWIETLDEPFENGVMGKHVIYHMEERPRVKIVDYTGSTKVERTKIDEKMKELGIATSVPRVTLRTRARREESVMSTSLGEARRRLAGRRRRPADDVRRRPHP